LYDIGRKSETRALVFLVDVAASTGDLHQRSKHRRTRPKPAGAVLINVNADRGLGGLNLSSEAAGSAYPNCGMTCAPGVANDRRMSPRTVRLSDYPMDLVEIACRKCELRGRFRKASLEAIHGRDFPLPDLKRHISSDCPRQRNRLYNNECGAYFSALATLP